MVQRGEPQEALRGEGRRLSLDEGRPGRRRMDIQERTFQFAVRVVKLVDRLPRTVAGMEVGRQLVRAATSVGANVEEADAAESRRDFVHKMKIAHKEAREARYWVITYPLSLRGGNSRRSNLPTGLEIASPPSAARNDAGR